MSYLFFLGWGLKVKVTYNSDIFEKLRPPLGFSKVPIWISNFFVFFLTPPPYWGKRPKLSRFLIMTPPLKQLNNWWDSLCPGCHHIAHGNWGAIQVLKVVPLELKGISSMCVPKKLLSHPQTAGGPHHMIPIYHIAGGRDISENWFWSSYNFETFLSTRGTTIPWFLHRGGWVGKWLCPHLTWPLQGTL